MIGDGPPLVLDRAQVEAARERIKTRYNVVKEQNLTNSRRPKRRPEERGETAMKTLRAASLPRGSALGSLAVASEAASCRFQSAPPRRRSSRKNFRSCA